MAIETERKYLDVDFEKIRARLKELGAVYLGTHFETNTLYGHDNPDCASGIRVVRLRRIEGPEGPSAVFTVKGAAQEGGAEAVCKIREELETEIGDPAVFNMILERMGYKEALVYEKFRESWRLSFESGGASLAAQIDMDRLPFADTVEIEGDCAAIDGAAALLRLDNSRISLTSYTKLYDEWAAGKNKENLPGLVFSPAEKERIIRGLGLQAF